MNAVITVAVLKDSRIHLQQSVADDEAFLGKVLELRVSLNVCSYKVTGVLSDHVEV